MKLLFNLEVVEGNRIKARPSDYLKSLPAGQQIAEVREFLHWAETEARENPDLTGRAEAEIGIATAREFLEKHGQQPASIITGGGNINPDD
ncbi:MAG: hypothetical protein OEU91_09670 [Gammaproteobacteria bacterium]|nr:hypothetical protein [Gammaproteobacteria bacterium]